MAPRDQTACQEPRVPRAMSRAPRHGLSCQPGLPEARASWPAALEPSSPPHPDSAALVPTSLENLSPSYPSHCFASTHHLFRRAPSRNTFGLVGSLTASLVLSPPRVNSRELPEWRDLAPSTCYPTEFIANPSITPISPELPGWRSFQSQLCRSQPGEAGPQQDPAHFHLPCQPHMASLSTACGSAFNPLCSPFPFFAKNPFGKVAGPVSFPGETAD